MNHRLLQTNQFNTPQWRNSDETFEPTKSILLWHIYLMWAEAHTHVKRYCQISLPRWLQFILNAYDAKFLLLQYGWESAIFYLRYPLLQTDNLTFVKCNIWFFSEFFFHASWGAQTCFYPRVSKIYSFPRKIMLTTE